MTDRITHAARSRWERGQTMISGRYVHLRWDELRPDIRDALVEEMRLTAADLGAGEATDEIVDMLGETEGWWVNRLMGGAARETAADLGISEPWKRGEG